MTRRNFAAVFVPLVVLGAMLVSASPASADVLIHVPKSQVCVGKTFAVGVWYQSHSGGPRSYRINVYAPGGRRIYHAEGLASSAAWSTTRIPAARAGDYRTVYRPGPEVKNQWVARFHTDAQHC
jgi:hypothetical protein